MRIALCNEVIGEFSFARQCEYAKALGYDGLEVAPFTLGEEPHRLSTARRREIRQTAENAGLAIVSLHWLLVQPAGLSITSGDAAVRARTREVIAALIELCAELGGRILVHGSPAQRRLPDGAARAAAIGWAEEAFAAAGDRAKAAGVVYCVEPLAPPDANYINTLAEAVALVRAIDNPALRTMLDCSAAGAAEAEPIAALLERWLPSGLIAHIQVNDRNRRGPGQGIERFAPILATLRRCDYRGDIAVEPFDYVPDGPGSAARAIGYIRGILEALP